MGQDGLVDLFREKGLDEVADRDVPEWKGFLSKKLLKIACVR